MLACNLIIFVVINFIFFKNDYIIKIKTITTITGLFIFVCKKIKVNSIWFWKYVLTVIDHVPVLFVPKTIKIIIAFHFLINFLVRLFLLFFLISIIYWIIVYLIVKKKETVILEKTFFKYFAIGFLFLYYQLHISFVLAAIIILIDFVIDKRSREVE